MQNNQYSDNRYVGYENRFRYLYRFISHVVSLLKTKNVYTENFNLLFKIVNTCIYETDWPMKLLPIIMLILPISVPMLPISALISMTV